MQNDNTIIESVKLLISRLEHLSADSRYAHRASGLRGSLWRCLEELEDGSQCNCDPSEMDGSQLHCSPSSIADKSQLHCDLPNLERLMAQGYQYLEAAAREIVAPEK
jgi:hypothetical protein